MSLLFNMLSSFVIAGCVEKNKVTVDMAISVCYLNEPKTALYPKTHYEVLRSKLHPQNNPGVKQLKYQIKKTLHKEIEHRKHEN